jgi:membrane protein insertase Oxa1/YidC/SpoIIIJ
MFGNQRRVVQSVLIAPFAGPAFPVAIVVGWCVSLLFEALQQMSATPEKFRHRTTTLISL